MMREPILAARNLSVHFPVRKGVFRRTVGHVRAVDRASFDIYPGQTLGLVGESGCGKTTLAKALVGLVPISDGTLMLEGVDISRTGRQQKELRSRMQMIFQDPFSSLNPRMSVGSIIGEAVRHHRPGGKWVDRVREYMELTGLRSEYFDRYPHEFSGGQRQRIGIARTLATQPSIVVADEPVSALDVSVQARVLNLMKRLQEELGLAYLFITHDLSVVYHVSHQIAVMYLGNIVERFPVENLREKTRHPYTRALLAAIPSTKSRGKGGLARSLEGEIPSPIHLPSGCPFHTRCPYADTLCRTEKPELEPIETSHFVACHHQAGIQFPDQGGRA